MKLIILVNCKIEKEVEFVDGEIIQNVFEEICDLPVGQFLDDSKIVVEQ